MKEKRQVQQVKSFKIDPENPGLTDELVNEYITNTYNGNSANIIIGFGFIHVVRNDLKEVTLTKNK